MQNEKVKKIKRSQDKMKSKRLTLQVMENAERILLIANKKVSGRKIKLNELLNMALHLVTAEHIAKLQTQSLTNADRQKVLRQKYIEIHGAATEEEFIGFTMTAAYCDFLKEHAHIVSM